MNRFIHPRRRLALVALPGILLASVITATPATASGSYQTVTENLRNPRGLAFSADGKLYVAEAGQAGDVCFPGEGTEEGGPLCAGLSSRVSRISTASGVRSDYITGLASLGGPLFALGASGVAVQGNQVYALMGANDRGVPPAEACGGGPACQEFLSAGAAQLGHLLRGVPSGGYAWKQDVGAFNFQWTVDNKDTIGAGNPAYQPGWAENPDFQPGDANPYGLAAAPGGTYMVDGGSNTLTWTPQNGSPKVIAALPNPEPGGDHPYDAVATCVAPVAGKVIVGDLNGRIFAIDGSSITVAPSAVSSSDGAFLASTGGCASDGRGNVYITDIFVGSVVKLQLSTMSLSWVAPPGTLNFPAGVAIRGGSLYISNNSVCPDFPTPAGPDNPCGGVTGSVVRMAA